MINDKSFDFSFSGLKTAVRYHIESATKEPGEKETNNICASFQSSVVDILTTKTITAAKEYQVKTITVTGGVAANSLLRANMTERAASENIRVFTPSLPLCTDNAAMIAFAGSKKIDSSKTFPYDLNAVSRWQL